MHHVSHGFVSYNKCMMLSFVGEKENSACEPQNKSFKLSESKMELLTLLSCI